MAAATGPGEAIIVRFEPGTKTGGGAPILRAVSASSECENCGSPTPATTSFGTLVAFSAANCAGVMAVMPERMASVISAWNPGCSSGHRQVLTPAWLSGGHVGPH